MTQQVQYTVPPRASAGRPSAAAPPIAAAAPPIAAAAEEANAEAGDEAGAEPPPVKEPIKQRQEKENRQVSARLLWNVKTIEFQHGQALANQVTCIDVRV